MVLASTNVVVVEQAPQNDYVPWGSTSRLLPLREALQDQQVCLTQTSFKWLHLPSESWSVWDVVHPVRVESIYHSALTLLKVGPTAFQSQIFWGFIFLLQDPREPDGGSDPSLLEENFCCCNYPPICGTPTQGMGLNYTVSLPLLPVSLWFLLYIFCCGRSFFLNCGLSHQ